jgi:DNA-binding MarR family transcriptional regulator
MMIELIRELHVRFQSALSEQIEGVSLSLDEYYALRVLVESPAPLKMSALGARLLRDASAATRVVDAMERRGLCRRMLTSEDRRARYVSITERGRETLADAEAVAASVERRAMQHLSARDAGELERLLLSLNDHRTGERDG